MEKRSSGFNVKSLKYLGRSLTMVSCFFHLLFSTAPSYGEDTSCEAAMECYAIAFNASALASSLREQGELVKWDDVRELDKAKNFFMGAVLSSCKEPNYWDRVEDYSERDYDRIIEAWRDRSPLDILSQYQSETRNCIQNIW